MLLIVALRAGNVVGTTIQEVLDAARKRSDRRIIWRNCDLPVIRAILLAGTGLHATNAAPTNQMTITLKDSGLEAGVIANLSAHDLRRGAARDTAHSKQFATGVATGVATGLVAATLGHSHTAFHRGTTNVYTGSMTMDVWKPRVADNYVDDFGTSILPKSSMKKKPRTPEEISALCERYGMDPKNRVARKRAERRGKVVDLRN